MFANGFVCKVSFEPTKKNFARSRFGLFDVDFLAIDCMITSFEDSVHCGGLFEYNKCKTTRSGRGSVEGEKS